MNEILNNKGIIIIFLAACFLSAYGAGNSFLGKQYNQEQFERIDGVNELIIEQMSGTISKEESERIMDILEKIVLKIEKNSEEIERLEEAENLLMKGYTELEFEGKIPEGLFIHYGIRDVINK